MRCFVAIVPPQATAQKLSQYVQSIQPAIERARAVAMRNLHLTLAFIGSIDDETAYRVSDALATLASHCFPACTWTLDRTGCFERARVFWVAGAPSAVLNRYAHIVRHTLNTLDVPFDAKPFVPHVTLLRKVRCALMTPPDIPLHIPWPLTRPVLMQSVSHADGVQYSIVTPSQSN